MRWVDVYKPVFKEGDTTATLVRDYTAKFHSWGFDWDEDSGVQYSVAIVERESGQVDFVYPKHIKFLSGEFS